MITKNTVNDYILLPCLSLLLFLNCLFSNTHMKALSTIGALSNSSSASVTCMHECRDLWTKPKKCWGRETWQCSPHAVVRAVSCSDNHDQRISPQQVTIWSFLATTLHKPLCDVLDMVLGHWWRYQVNPSLSVVILKLSILCKMSAHVSASPHCVDQFIGHTSKETCAKCAWCGVHIFLPLQCGHGPECFMS